jgi:hypothetical protein
MTTKGATLAERLRPERSAGIAEPCLLTLAGGLAFWVVTIACSLLPVVPEFRRAFSISSGDIVLGGSLVGGLVIGCGISMALLRFSSRIPGRGTLSKSLVLSCAALGLATIVLWATSQSIDTDATRAFFIGALLNVPRFPAVGAVIGALHRWLHKPATGTNQLDAPTHLIGKAGMS